MTPPELIQALTFDSPVAVVITDAQVQRPGPTILYANPAFERLTGRSTTEIIGVSPRFMQGRETRRPVLDTFAKALSAGERFHGFLTNYRGDGTKYVVEIDCRPLSAADGRVQHFISFEREVTRRRGRPFLDRNTRFEPLEISNRVLAFGLRQLGVFGASEVEVDET